MLQRLFVSRVRKVYSRPKIRPISAMKFMVPVPLAIIRGVSRSSTWIARTTFSACQIQLVLGTRLRTKEASNANTGEDCDSKNDGELCREVGIVNHAATKVRSQSSRYDVPSESTYCRASDNEILVVTSAAGDESHGTQSEHLSQNHG